MSLQNERERTMRGNPPILTAQGYYNLGYTAGQQFYQREPEHQPTELHRIAQRETEMQDLPMVMQAQYRDGFVAGYGPKQEGDTKQ